METIENHDQFESRSVWLSAYLIAFGCDLLQIIPVAPRRSRFIHNNAEGQAVRLMREWRDEADAMVNGPALVKAYRHIMDRLHQAEGYNREEHDTRRDEQYYDTGIGRQVA
jgi:hypothetical protein